MKYGKRENQKSINRFIQRGIAVLLSMSLALLATRTVGDKIGGPMTDSDGMTTWDCVYFGSYWQNDTNGDGKADRNDQKEPIKWRVLWVDGEEAFLLADQSLDRRQYHKVWRGVSWETCTLRSWLNGYSAGSNVEGKDYGKANFLDAAFTQTEQSAICQTSVVNEDNPEYWTRGGNDTQDEVYLLSIEEASNASYGFSSNFSEESETRYCVSTEYAKEQGGLLHRSDAMDSWWLRSPGGELYEASCVTYEGFGGCSGISVNLNINGVRPVLRLNLLSDVWRYAGKVTSGKEFLTDSSGNAYTLY